MNCMKISGGLVLLLVIGLSGCVADRNLPVEDYSKEVPPWGEIRRQGAIWSEGRPIMKNPMTETMDEVFLDLGFYDSDRNAMNDAIHGVFRDRSCIASQNYFFFRGAGSDPKLEIFRKIDGDVFALEVFVSNSGGLDHSISWRYNIGYEADLNRWIFEKIEIARNHQWGVADHIR